MPWAAGVDRGHEAAGHVFPLSASDTAATASSDTISNDFIC
jgi:hypothetical protein